MMTVRVIVSERGGVLTYLAVGISLFLAVVGVTIDINRLVIAHRQAEHLTRLASFAALEGYIQAECAEDDSVDQCELKKQTGARGRANAVLKKNKILGRKLEQVTESSDLKLQPGRYETDETKCSDAGFEKAPCFRDAQSDETVNAMRLSGQIGELVGTAFSRGLVGFFSPTLLSTSAEAALVPRRGCFVVDVSASTIRETFPLWRTETDSSGQPLEPPRPVCGQGHQFTFPLVQGFGSMAGIPANPRDLQEEHFESSVSYWMQWNWLAANYWQNEGTWHPACDSPKDFPHWGEDYGYKLTMGNDHYSAYLSDKGHPDPLMYPTPTDEGDWFLVNLRQTHPFDSSFPFRIEPLQVIFEGLEKALTDFKARSVAGDKACIVFHDESLQWPRIVNLTEDFDYLLELVKFGDFTGLAADDPFTPPTSAEMAATEGRERALHHNLFGHPSQNTDTYRALQYALNQFEIDTQDGGVPSADFVVLIGDGLHTCVNCMNEGAYEFSSSMAWSCSGNPGSSSDCRRMYQAWHDGMKDIQKMVEEQFIPNQIPLNVILTGEQVKPHTVAIKEPGSNKCFSDYDWRTSASDCYKTGADKSFYCDISNFTKPAGGNSYEEGSAEYHKYQSMAFSNRFRYDSGTGVSKHFYTAAKPWYQFAALTRGVWGPIRPYHQAACGEDPDAVSFYHRDSSGRPRLKCPGAGKDDDSGGASREVYDPYCRTPTAQMSEYMELIIGTTPFFLINSE